MRRPQWPLALLLLTGCRNFQTADARSPVGCVWSQRDSIRIDSGLAYVEPPITVPIGKDLVVIGNSAVHRSLGGVIQRRSPASYLLAGIRIGEGSQATPIDFPDGVRDFNRVRIAGVTDNRVVVVWQGGFTLADTGVSRLWTSTLAGELWSPPQLLGDWQTRDLGIYYASGLTASDGYLGLVVPQGTDSTFVYLKTNGWHRQLIRVTSLYDALLPISGGFLLGVIDGSALRVTRLGLDGTVGPFHEVASNGGDFNYPILMGSTDAGLVAAWVDGVGIGRSTVRVARSRDGGDSWTDGSALRIDGGIESFDAILAEGGVVYITGRQSTEHGPWPIVAELRSGVWRILPVPRLPNEVAIVPPRFSRRDREVELYWALDEKRRMNREPPALVRAHVRNDCQS